MIDLATTAHDSHARTVLDGAAAPAPDGPGARAAAATVGAALGVREREPTPYGMEENGWDGSAEPPADVSEASGAPAEAPEAPAGASDRSAERSGQVPVSGTRAERHQVMLFVEPEAPALEADPVVGLVRENRRRGADPDASDDTARWKRHRDIPGDVYFAALEATL